MSARELSVEECAFGRAVAELGISGCHEEVARTFHAAGYRAALAVREESADIGLLRETLRLADKHITAIVNAPTDRERVKSAELIQGEIAWVLRSPCEVEELPGDGQRPEAPLTRAVSSCCEAWIEVKPSGYHCSTCGMTCGKVAPVVRDTEREHGHRLDRVSFLSGYIQAATLMLRGIVKPNNDGAITMAAERAWKATGADTEREHEPDQHDASAQVWEAEQCGRIAAEASEVLDNLLESLQRVDVEGQAGDVEDYDAALEEASDLLKRLGDPQQERLHALRAHQHAKVLAEALDQYRKDLDYPFAGALAERAAVDRLLAAVAPTLRALGYGPKEKTPC